MISIGNIGNYYGNLEVKTEGGRYWWAIENYSGHNWEEISEPLYKALLAHNNWHPTEAAND